VNKPGIELQVQPDLHEFRVQAHRVGLVQVLGNLILNAYESILRSQAKAGTIRVTASRDDIDGKAMVSLTVSDSGSGFAADVKHNIFQRGFSSKEGHQRGLGLHWCANALGNMGGRISADSEGPELGAAFHVVLPDGSAGKDVHGGGSPVKRIEPASRAERQRPDESDDTRKRASG